MLAGRLWHASSPRGGGCRALRATASLKRPSPLLLLLLLLCLEKCGEEKQRQREKKTRQFLYSFHCFFPPPPPQRTRCAVHEEEEETLRRLRFLFSYMIPLRLIWDRTLLTSFAAKYRTGKADWIAFAGGTTGHDEHLSYRDIIQTNA